MTKTISFISTCVALVAFGAAGMQPVAAAGTFGAGPHGYDWEIGTWSCTNSMPSPMGGPSKQTLTVSRTNGGAIMYRATGSNFDNVWYNVYLPNTQSWVSPFVVANGTHGSESTSQTGAKVVWVGVAYDATGKMMHVRDTNSLGLTKYTDLGEYQSGGAWKEQYLVSCVKT
ncbi:MAG: hypothetical protein JOY69_08875 [Candidatus Eremiobacteraeota bacterium]|nr:hypothetical protein [Candidatus Eremiobacteraeota bacterium]